MGSKLHVGVIGCGNISTAYFTLSKMFLGFEITACADIDESVAKIQAEKFGLTQQSVASLLEDDSIDLIVNLTVPTAHFDVSRRALESGKHVYSEKPFVLELSQGLELSNLAKSKNLKVGSAPDTFLGGAHQLARFLIDRNEVGSITSGSCHVMGHGMEHWHPNPDFFFKKGGGPILDVGPYYVANLVNLIGPVTEVSSMSSIPAKERTISNGPRNGEKIEVETPTTILGLLKFATGALVSLSASWDVWTHNHNNMELYGTEGTLFVPDPNFFGGEVKFTIKNSDAMQYRDWDHPLSVPNQEHPNGKTANYRTIGLADMADSIINGRSPRCSLELAIHVIDVLTGLLNSSQTREIVEMTTTCQQSAPLTASEARSLMQT